ncbi:MAG: metallophosphoesterase [Elusimicrobiota bacterium]
MRFLVLLATTVSAASWFDSPGLAPRLLAPPAPVHGVRLVVDLPADVPPDLIAAASRVGHGAMMSKLDRSRGDSFAFGVIGDAEPGRFWFQRLLNPGDHAFADQWRSIQKTGIDFTLQLGDFVSLGDVDHYRQHVELLERNMTAPVFHCIGNHDRSTPNGGAHTILYESVFGPRNYYFDYGGWRFVSLDTSYRKLTPPQLLWLKYALSAPGPKVVFTHVPPAYLKGLKPLEEVQSSDPAIIRVSLPEESNSFLNDFFTNYFEDGAGEFEELVSQSGVKAVYMGHIHAFWAADHRGVRYIISGGGGSPLYNPLPPGYPKKHFAHSLRVKAGPGGLEETVIPLTGQPFVLPPVKP